MDILFHFCKFDFVATFVDVECLVCINNTFVDVVFPAGLSGEGVLPHAVPGLLHHGGADQHAGNQRRTAGGKEVLKLIPHI